ncbi:MAG: AAA family ATPase [Candidatus Protochlamydia sp.]|nr:AAA family ATPase [Candidatus Protochlamydia sp.]
MKKRLPIGISDFKRIIEGDYAYVDKTLLIQELVEKGMAVALIPRLRRFGKTLNLSMLRYFFEQGKEDTSYLFKNTKIWENEKYRAMQGCFPVIFLTLKDVKHASWQNTFASLQELIGEEFGRHDYLLEDTILTATEKEDYQRILRKESDLVLTEKSLFLLTKWLQRYYNKNVILLIDEYDTPAHAAYLGGYYESLINFLRNWLSAGLKDNASLELGVLTGILRIAKESIFSGLNNISTFTILNDTFSDKFGLLESEVKELLDYYDLSEKINDVRRWYNGYRIGTSTNIYNPWSVLNCITNKGVLAPYWVNTSENALMKKLIAQSTGDFKANLETLLKGGHIEEEIEEGIVFSELQYNPKSLWSLLLYCGYLTLETVPSYGTPCHLRIPNIEICELYRSMILDWFNQSIHKPNYHLLLNSLISGDIDTFSQIFQEFMFSSVSVFDVPSEESEKIYHGFILGILIGLSDRYEVKSNRESGLGRYDVMLIPKNQNDLGIIMEFKKIGRFEKSTLEEAVESALKQIEDRHYAQELIDRGVKNILLIGFAFEGKQVIIRSKNKDRTTNA